MTEHTIKVIKSNNLAWDKLFLEHEFFIINYHADVDFPEYSEINELFEKLALEPQYNKVKFLRVDSNNNPIAHEFLKKRKLPFVAIFKKGFLIECNTIDTEIALREMLKRLFDFKIKL